MVPRCETFSSIGIAVDEVAMIVFKTMIVSDKDAYATSALMSPGMSRVIEHRFSHLERKR